MWLILALGFVQFFFVVGWLIDAFREGPLTAWFVKVVHVSWRDLPYIAVEKADRFLSKLFGEKILSVRSISFTAIISVTINCILFTIITVLPTFYTLYRIDYFIAIETLKFLIALGIGAAVFGALHDVISVVITRKLMRSFLISRNGVYIIQDIFISYILLVSAMAMVTTGYTLAWQFYVPDKAALITQTSQSYNVLLFWIVNFQLYLKYLTPFVDANILNILGTRTFAILASLTTLLPTWLYIATAALSFVFAWLGRFSIHFLYILGFGHSKAYTISFSLVAVLLVILAWIAEPTLNSAQ